MVSLLLGGLLLVMLAGVWAVAGLWPQATWPLGGLGLGLLALAGREAARSNKPLLLTSSCEALHLAPLGSSIAKGIAAETIPLASVRAYAYWVRIFRYGVFTQYHLRLELADGRVLHLADRPGTRPDDPAGAVHLDAVAQKLPRWLKPGVPRRPLFYLTRLARSLLGLSWGAIAGALLLMWLGHPVAMLALYPAVGYWVSLLPVPEHGPAYGAVEAPWPPDGRARGPQASGSARPATQASGANTAVQARASSGPARASGHLHLPDEPRLFAPARFFPSPSGAFWGDKAAESVVADVARPKQNTGGFPPGLRGWQRSAGQLLCQGQPAPRGAAVHLYLARTGL